MTSIVVEVLYSADSVLYREIVLVFDMDEQWINCR
jgi:hypothetical protein